MTKPVALGLPGIDEKLGTIPAGSLVTIIGDPETYPHVLAYTIASRKLALKQKVAVIVVADALEDHLALLENLGTPVKPLINAGLLRCTEAPDLDTALQQAQTEAYHADLVIVEATAAQTLNQENLLNTCRAIRKTEALLVLTAAPVLLGTKQAAILVRYSDAAFKLHLIQREHGVERMIILAYTKTRPHRDLAFYYTITEQGVAIETLSRI